MGIKPLKCKVILLNDDDVRSHTAIHILKGAVMKVLGAKWSSSAYSSGAHGGLAVRFERKPTEEEVNKIEDLSNEKIKEDAIIEIFELSKQEAEDRWGDAIYDLFSIPSELTHLKVFHLPNWNVNTCGRVHCKTTREIGGLKIVKWRYRPNKQLLELSFDITGNSINQTV